MSLATLTPRVREALGLSASYDATIIPSLITRCARRFLRDYNFPKSMLRQTTPMTEGLQSWVVPSGLGKILDVRYANPTDGTFSDALRRREGFSFPVQGDMSSHRWWLDGTIINISNPATADMQAQGVTVQMTYQTIEPASATWIYDDFEDVLFTFAVYRGAAENRKPEVQQVFGQLWAEDMQSLAIYLNELEYDNLEMVQREERPKWRERYPINNL